MAQLPPVGFLKKPVKPKAAKNEGNARNEAIRRRMSKLSSISKKDADEDEGY